MKKTFHQYLINEHARTYRGTDDAMPDAFESWLEKQDRAYFAEGFIFDEPIDYMPITFGGDALDWQHEVERERLRDVLTYLSA